MTNRNMPQQPNQIPKASSMQHDTLPDSQARVNLLILFLFLTVSMTASIRGEEADHVGFEKAQPGTFETLQTALGSWTSPSGQPSIDHRHAKTGKQCLHLRGGNQSSVTLQLNTPLNTDGQLSFWAERWTARQPFKFRIETHADGRWQEIYNGDSKIRVGRAFLSEVRVPLRGNQTQRLRFTCSSPPDTGILIDDVRINADQPQELVDVKVVPFTLPALVRTPSSPLAKLQITTKGRLNPLSLTQVSASINGREKLSSLKLELHGISTEIGLPLPEAPQASSSWKTSIELNEGENTLWLSGTLKNLDRIEGTVGATLHEASFSNGAVVKLNALNSTQRLGIALRQADDDDVHTYRIPGLATTTKGTLIGVYDIRRKSGGDLPGDIDVGMSRSTDGGHTWEPMKTIMDMGNDPRWRYDGIGDPAILVDKNTGTIWVAATWSHGNRSWHGSGPGLTPEETGQVMLVRSDDDGVTWSQPMNITRQIKKPEWCFILQGPGKGITMRDGTLVFAAQYQDSPEKQRLPHSTIIFSKDHGKSWSVGSGAFDDTTESQVVEVEPGVLMLNCRYNRGDVRVVMTTQDMGQTWQEHPTSRQALIEPRSCMASLIDIDQELGKDSGGWLLFSNPNSTSGRNHITIKASRDGGLTWPEQFQLLLDEGNSAGYSCLSMIDEQTVGILYEGSQAHLTFQRVPLKSLIGMTP